ncbi:AraC family transcriptional regulator [bacterium]|nr:AraC family transcriptional regulator [bacterium]
MDESRRGLSFHGKTAKEAQALMAKIYTVRPGILRIGLLLELLDRLAKSGQGRPLASEGYRTEPVKERTGKKMHELLHYVEDHWTEPLRLEEAARRVKMHPRSLSRFFRRQMGTTFQDYVVNVRLGRAARRLIEDEAQVSEVAYASGFNNLSNFTAASTTYPTSTGFLRAATGAARGTTVGACSKTGRVADPFAGLGLRDGSSNGIQFRKQILVGVLLERRKSEKPPPRKKAEPAPGGPNPILAGGRNDKRSSRCPRHPW